MEPLVERLLVLAAGRDVNGSIRTMSLAVLRWMVTWKTKAMVRRRLVPVILPVAFGVMAEAEYASEADEDSDAASVYVTARETLGALFERVPPEYLVPLTVRAFRAF